MKKSLCYLNGKTLPLENAQVSVLDRGFLFGDGVYEVIPVYDGKPFAWRQHLARLRRSLREIRLPFDVTTLFEPLHQIVQAGGNDGKHALYIQITRGAAAARKQQPPADADISPTVFMMCNPYPPIAAAVLEGGVACVTMEDFRWQRGDIKSVSLLAAVMLAGEAANQNAYETVLLRNGILTEGNSSNYLVVQNKQISTPLINSKILSGITCRVVLQQARRLGFSVIQRDIERAELSTADEIWLTSSLREIIPVTSLDGAPIGSGKAGEVFKEVYAAWQNKIGQG